MEHMCAYCLFGSKKNVKIEDFRQITTHVTPPLLNMHYSMNMQVSQVFKEPRKLRNHGEHSFQKRSFQAAQCINDKCQVLYDRCTLDFPSSDIALNS